MFVASTAQLYLTLWFILFLVPHPWGLPGEGPDGHLPWEIEGFCCRPRPGSDPGGPIWLFVLL